MSNKNIKVGVQIDTQVKNLKDIDKLINELEQSGTNVDKLRKQSQDLSQTWGNLGASEQSQALKKMQGELDKTANKTGLLERASGKLKNGFIGLRTAIASAFAVGGMTAFFRSAVSGAASLEEQLSKVKAVSGATDTQMQAIAESAEQLGASTRYTATEAAQGFEILARAGLDTQQSLTAIPSVLDLAQASGIGLADAAGFITKTVAGMNMAMSESGHVADVLAQAAASANTDVAGLGQALSYAAPTANSLGVSLEDTVAIIGKFADAGIDASRAGTALNSIMAQFSNPASKFRQELQAIGINTGDFVEALRQLEASGQRGAKAINAVGMEAGPALKALLAQGMESVDALSGKLDDVDDVSKKMANTMNDNLPGAVKGLSSAWDTLKNNLGKPLLEPLKEQVNKLAQTLRTWVADGTVASIGQSIATGFKAATQAVSLFGGHLAKIITVMGVVKVATMAYTATLGRFATAATAGATASKALLTTLRGFAGLGLGLAITGLSAAIDALTPKTHAWQQSLDAAFDSLVALQVKAAQGIEIKTGDLTPFNEQMAEIDRQIEELSNKETGIFDFAKDAIPWLDSNNQQLMDLLQRKNELKNQEIQLNAQIKANETAEQQRADKAKAYAEEQKQVAQESIEILEKRKAELEKLGDTESDHYQYIVGELHTLNKTLDDTATKTRQAFEAAGLSLGEVKTGITDTEQQLVNGLAPALDYLAKTTRNVGEATERYLVKAIAKFSTPEGLKAYLAELEALPNKTKAVTDAIDSVKRKLYETNPAFLELANSIAKATKVEQLAEFGKAAKQAFDEGKLSAQEYKAALDNINNKTAEVQQKATQSTQAASTATKEATQSTKAATTATKEATTATQADSKAKDDNAKSSQTAGSAAAALANQLAGIRNSFKESEAAVKQFDAVMMAHGGRMGSWLEYDAQLERAGAAAKQKFKEYTEALKEAEAYTEAVTRKAQDGTISQQDFAGAALYSADAVSVLNKADLAQLSTTIESARQKMLSLEQDAKRTAQAIADRLTNATGTQEQKINLRYQREAEAIKAKAKGGAGQAAYNQALADLEKLRQIELDKARQQAQEQARQQREQEQQRQRQQREREQQRQQRQQQRQQATSQSVNTGTLQKDINQAVTAGISQADLSDLVKSLGENAGKALLEQMRLEAKRLPR